MACQKRDFYAFCSNKTSIPFDMNITLILCGKPQKLRIFAMLQ
ncbi:hypothetical protein C3B79_0482 [Aeromonas hydrophila]|nr:hypothetical protein C3B79_0482 [Aeromonas hydrophila]